MSVLGLIATGWLLLLFSDFAQGERDEVFRISSPDSVVDVVVIWSSGGGAAGWSDMFVYLTTAGDSATGPPIIWTDGPKPEIRWIEPGYVEMEPKAFVREFRNFWVSPIGDTVEVRLRPRSGSGLEAAR